MMDGPELIPLEAARAAQEPWAAPDMSVLKEGRRQPPELPLDVFGPFWAMWVAATAEGCSAPRDYVATGLLGIASVLIGNAGWVSPWPGWSEPSALWIANIGIPSSGKSPAMDSLLNIVANIESEMAAGFSDELRQWRTQREAAKVARALWEADVKAAVNEGVPPPDMPEAADEPNKPVRPRLLVSDVTPEVMGQLIAAHPKGLAFRRDELSGFLGGFDRYGGGGERAFWIEAYGGRAYVIDRVKLDGESIRIPHLLVTIMGGMQPDRLASTLLTDDDDGLAARFLYSWPEPVTPRRPRVIADMAAAEVALRRLLALVMDADDNDQPTLRVLKLDDDAAEEFEAWQQRHAKQCATGMLGSHFGKSPGHVLRLAIALQLLWWSGMDGQSEPATVSKAAVLGAICLVDEYFKPMAERAFGDAVLPVEERNAATLARWLLQRTDRPTRINASDLRRNARLPGLRTTGAMKAALDVLAETDWLRPDPTREGKTRGRKRDDYLVNPRIPEQADG